MTDIPFGRWPSSVTTDLLTAQAIRISEPQQCGDRLFWLETRPQERGRTALVCEQHGQRTDLLPAPHSVRTRAQEYGGGSYLAIKSGVFCVLDVNQRIYFYSFARGALSPVTPEGSSRYADFCYDALRTQLLAVCEATPDVGGHPRASIIAIDLTSGVVHERVSGADFYSNPRLSPDGKRLTYLRWNHPQMPWDGTECVCAELSETGEILREQRVAGGAQESIFQPTWSPQGDLLFVSDRNNWWNLYRWNGQTIDCVCDYPAEFATPQWVFGMSTCGFIDDYRILCTYTQKGTWQLGLIDVRESQLVPIQSDFRDISGVHCYPGGALFIAASATRSTQLYHLASGKLTAKTEAPPSLPLTFIAAAQAIEFPTRDGETAHAFFYAPTHPTLGKQSATGSPPLLVMCHGGPTGATESSLNLKIQFWTSRGFAVLDVNYRGSTGYGRHYRERLKGNWGITDVIDVCSGVDYLVERELVNPDNVAIRGSSAGGYTVLAALTFSNTFGAGASLYGIGDLEALARDTHKFEAHYLDSLVGPYPQEAATYRARSPIHHIDQLRCPVIFLQGLQDKIVPPAQAEAMVSALRRKGIETEYITFADEGHGFRQAANIQQALEAELAFYLRLFAPVAPTTCATNPEY